MEYDKELKGYLWNETQSTVVKKGTIQIKGKEEYAAIVRSVNNEGKEKYELMISAGLLHVNKEEDKKSPKSPDIGGPITFGDVVYKFGGWARTSEKGNEYTSVSLQVKENEDAPKEEVVKEKIPF